VDCTQTASCEVWACTSGGCEVDCGPGCKVHGNCLVSCTTGVPTLCPDGVTMVCGSASC
jgi:hypothetical protein